MSLQAPDEEKRDARRRDFGKFVPLAWAFLIFFTSCFVIFTPEFFKIVDHMIPSRAGQTRFEIFWYAVGIFIIKGWHATEYAILDSLAFRYLQSRMPIRRALLISLLICIAFAASDEWHQTFVPGRGGNVRDVMIDTAGAAIATAVIAARLKRARNAGDVC